MPSFTYKAYLKNGRVDTGTVDASDENSAFQVLSKNGKLPFHLKPASRRRGLKSRNHSAGSFTIIDRVDTTRMFAELSVLLQSGFTVDQALTAAVSDSGYSAERSRFEAILAKLKEGKSIAESFKTDDIPNDVIALISAGENSGNLPKVFKAIASRYEDMEKRRREVQEALLYPLFLLIMMVAAIFVLAFFLVPAIEPIFEGSKSSTPFVVSALSSLRQFLTEYGMSVMIVLLLGLCFTFFSKRLRQVFTSLGQHVPFLGALLTETAVARYLSVLHLLLANGVTMKESMKLATETATIRDVKAALESAENDVTSGSNLHSALSNSNLLSNGLLAHIRIGEESNNLPIMLSRAASSMELRIKGKIERFLKFLTPAITILLGLLIGGLVTSVMTTLLSINEFAIR